MLYNIIYELKNAERDYSTFFSALKTFSTSNQCMKNSWFVKTNKNKQEIYDNLKQHLDTSDLLLITQTSLTNLSGWLPIDSVNWLQEHSKDSLL